MNETRKVARGTILKIRVAHLEPFQVPADARPLSVGWEDGHCCLWMIADPEVPKVTRRPLLLSTGHELAGDGFEFCGTIQAPGRRVFHVFISGI